ADREVRVVATALGPAQVKVKRMDGKVVAVAPEYRVCRALAERHGLPLTEVYRIVEDAARAELAMLPPETLARGESP
ncbi:MAG: DUF111 family protein, partial [Dehalococcoidia bacterium]|nr:DUF111 family protein [Dehalococcoidia bacterium]